LLALAIEFRIQIRGSHPQVSGALALRYHRFGGYSGGETPGSIPNPEVKPSSADGTAPETGWESRSPPRHSKEKGPPRGALLVFRVRFAGASIPFRPELPRRRESPKRKRREREATPSAIRLGWRPGSAHGHPQG